MGYPSTDYDDAGEKAACRIGAAETCIRKELFSRLRIGRTRTEKEETHRYGA